VLVIARQSQYCSQQVKKARANILPECANSFDLSKKTNEE